MADNLNFNNCEFPSDWEDDVRMNFMFGTFRDRWVNPEGHDAKMSFWINIIEDLCIKSNSPVVSLLKLCSALERKTRQPLCLEVVLEKMIKQGKIVSLGEYTKLDSSKGWLEWGFNVFVQKPVSWGFSSIQSLFVGSEKDDKYIVVSVIKNLASKVLNRYHELIGTKWNDSAVFLDHLKEECMGFCTNSSFQLAIIHLQKEKEAYVYEEYGEKVVKFRKKDEKHVQPLSELDKGILSLNRARDTILEDINTLEDNVLSCHEMIKENLRTNSKSKAMLFLKKKKRLETALQKKSVALDNVENLLTQLKNAGSEKMVLNAYRIGVQAMKNNTTGELNIDSIDDVMADVKEVLDDYAEVQNTLSKSMGGDESLENFEAELQELLSEEPDSLQQATKRKSDAPQNIDADLERRLAALRAPPNDAPPIKKPTLSKPIRAP